MSVQAYAIAFMHGFTLTPPSEKSIVVHQQVNNPDVPARLRIEFDVDPDLGFMTLDSVQNRYFDISNTHVEFKHDVIMRPFSRDTHYGLAIMNSPKGTVKFNNGEWVDVKRGQTYFTFNPGVDEVHHFEAGRPMISTFIDIKHDYLTTFLAEQQPKKGTALYDFHERVMKNEFAGASADIFTPSFHHVISGMFNCPMEGTFGNLMLEGALQQVLAMQFAMLGNETPVKVRIPARDRDVITAVKDHLDVTFNDDHSLISLSKKFGINQNKLKTQFREMFGVPVIGYLYDRKMEHARSLLLDKGMFVSEVASIVGYRNSNHFATAFKRKFGINPSALKH